MSGLSLMNVNLSTSSDALFSAKGLVIVITGGGTGLGLAFAKALLNAGAKKIYLLGRRLAVLESSAAFLDPSRQVVGAIQVDVADAAAINAAVAQIGQEVGHVDVLINNAGIGGPVNRTAYEAANIAEVSEILRSDWEGWQTTFATNTWSVVGVSAAFLPLLEKGNERRGWSSGKLEAGGPGRQRDVELARRNGFAESDYRLSQIITVASIAGFMRNVMHGLAYNSSKAGAIQLGKILASMLAPWGIRSNVIAPGLFPSELTVGAKEEWSVNEIPANRAGSFEEIVGTILHLVGQSGGYKNGAVEVVDGGRISVFPATY